MKNLLVLRWPILLVAGTALGALLGGVVGTVLGGFFGDGYPEDGFVGFLYGVYVGAPWGLLLGAATAWVTGRRRSRRPEDGSGAAGR